MPYPHVDWVVMARSTTVTADNTINNCVNLKDLLSYVHKQKAIHNAHTRPQFRLKPDNLKRERMNSFFNVVVVLNIFVRKMLVRID